MECRKIQEWLEESGDHPLSELPQALADHSSRCPECSRQLAFMKGFQKESQGISLSQNRADSIFENITSEIRKPSSHPATPQSAEEFDWAGLFSWLTPTLALAIAVVFALFSPTGGNRPKTPEGGKGSVTIGASLASVSGSGGEIEFKKQPFLPLNATPVPLEEGETLSLKGPGATCEVGFRDGGKIRIFGSGRFTLRKEGFSARENADCRVSFDRSSKGYMVEVPGVLLKVAGTEIALHLINGSGTALLLSGKVEVVPDSGGTPFGWTASVTLRIGPFGVSVQAGAGVDSAIQASSTAVVTTSSTVTAIASATTNPGAAPGESTATSASPGNGPQPRPEPQPEPATEPQLIPLSPLGSDTVSPMDDDVSDGLGQ